MIRVSRRTPFFYRPAMVEITEIRMKELSATVSFSTGESAELPHGVLLLHRLAKGKLIETLEYLQLKEESDRYLCRQKALKYLSIRNRSSAEMETYLRKKDFSKEIIREVLAGVREAGYIDDLEFARAFIRYRRGRKVVGEHLLRSELYRKGVARDLVSRALAETRPEAADPDEVFRLARKKLQSLGTKRNRTQKLAHFLRQRGFDGEAIRAVLDRLRGEGEELQDV